MSCPDECANVNSSRRIRVSEKGKCFTLVNEGRAKHTVLHVDGCAIQVGARCDWAIFLESGCEIYIELKGTDISHAYEQITTTICRLTKVHERVRRTACVVASRVPAEDTTTQRLRLALAKWCCRTIVRSRVLEIDESALFD